MTEHHLEFLSLKGGCTGSAESTLVKTPHCWKSHVVAHIENQGIYSRVHIHTAAAGKNSFQSNSFTKIITSLENQIYKHNSSRCILSIYQKN